MSKKQEDLLEKIIRRASNWQESSQGNSIKSLEKIQNFMKQKENKNFMIEIMDQSFRASANRTEKQIHFIMNKYKNSVSNFFSIIEQIGIKVALFISNFIPGFMTFFLTDRTRRDSRSFVIALEGLSKHLNKRVTDKIYANVNQIGEEVLSEHEAKRRLKEYTDLLEDPYVNYISVKASTLFSQINSLAMDNSVEEVSKRLRILYSHAMKNKNQNSIYGSDFKFVNLDMEEYKDLEVTILSFMKVLDEEEFKNYTAGIVLQAYLPDSFPAQKKLTEWAIERTKKGNASIKIRLVKGANMEMEKTESSVHGWEVAPYEQKVDTDSNYKRMLKYGLEDERFKSVRLGIASHNLFDIAYAYEMIILNSAFDFVDFEMLEGMGQIHYNALKKDIKSFVFYTPTCSKKHFTNAIGYLVRRLDENSDESNFMRYISNLKVNSDDWNKLKDDFIQSYQNIDTVSFERKRKQDRNKELELSSYSDVELSKFENEVDTDFTLIENRHWAENILKNWKTKTLATTPIVVAGKEIIKENKIYEVSDKSQLEINKKVGKFSLAEKEDVQTAIKTAYEDVSNYSKKKDEERYNILRKVADEIRKNRGDLIGIAAAEVGKVFTQTDVEITEAIDFLNFYTHADFINKKDKNVEFSPRGVGVILSPWNFPIAIPIGSITSALVTGNRVIFKPAKEAALCGWHICQCFWNAGIDKNTLQFLPTEDEIAGKYLITDERVDFAIFTGSSETAKKIMMTNPDLFFSGEAGGKNAIIVSSLSDREQAIKHICHSAFFNSGQKCSASSLVILEKEVYEDEKFRSMLKEAASSMPVGSVWEFQNSMSTIIDNPNPNLKHAIENLETNETWDIKPEFVGDNPYMLKPSIRFGTKKENFTYKNELFGPMISIMKAENLEHAIEMVNSSEYGLTSGLETLDENEKKIWVNKVEAGNLYINRETTGAIVLRQPFGGMKKSAIGSGRKAGFYNYLPQFTYIKNKDDKALFEGKFEQIFEEIKDYSELNIVSQMYKEITENDNFSHLKPEMEKFIFALNSYIKANENIFTKAKDYTNIRGEENVLRYLPVKSLFVRINEQTSLYNILAILFVCKIVDLSFLISIHKINKNFNDFILNYKSQLMSKGNFLVQSENDILDIVLDYERIRFIDKNDVSDKLKLRLAENLGFIVTGEFLLSGNLELLNYYKEQSISHRFHRYGNLVGEDRIF